MILWSLPKGWKNHYQASKENYSRCSNRDCVEGGQDIPSFHKQLSSILIVSVGSNGQYPYLGMYNTAPHSKRKQHTPSWTPAMTLSGNPHRTIQLEGSGKLPKYCVWWLEPLPVEQKLFLLAQNTPVFLLGKIPRRNFPPLKIFIWNNIPLQRLDIYMNTAI